MSALCNPCLGDDQTGADEAHRERMTLPPDPRVDLWSGVIWGDRRVRIETYYGRLEVYTRPLGASAWRVATEQEEAEATIKALDEKPWVEDAIRAGCLERHRARSGGAQ